MNTFTRRAIVWIASVYVIGFFTHALYLGKTVYGDGAYYYAWLTLEPSKFSVGPALFWSPVYLLTHNEIAVGAASVLAAIFGLVLLWELLLKKFNPMVSILTIATVAGATNLLFYGSIDAVNSHALSFFAATVFLSLLFAKTKNWFALGVALGLVGLMRTQDLLYGLLLIPYLKKHTIVPIISGFIIMFLPQLIAWQIVSGKFWMSPYLVNEGFNFLQPHLIGVLFNLQNGLFVYTPITILGFAGLLRDRRFLMLAVVLLELYVVASWGTWWQGASYSARMLVSSLPLLSFGIASVFAWLAKGGWKSSYFLYIFIIPLSLLNALMIIYFLITIS